MTEEVKFSVTYLNFRKCISVHDTADLHRIVYQQFKDCPKFPRRIRLQFEEEGLNEFIDLDSPLQLAHRRSNRLLVLPDLPVPEESASEFEDDSDEEPM